MSIVTQIQLCEFLLAYTPYVERPSFFFTDKVPVGYNSPNNKFREKIPITYREIDKYGIIREVAGEFKRPQDLTNYLNYKQYGTISLGIYRPSGKLHPYTFGTINAELSQMPWVAIQYECSKIGIDEWDVSVQTALPANGDKNWQF